MAFEPKTTTQTSSRSKTNKTNKIGYNQEVWI